MKKPKRTASKKMGYMERLSSEVTAKAGSTPAFVAAFSLVGVWAITGPLFRFSEEWQMVINTGTTIVTFLMVFLIQKSQNKDSLAVQLKLNELIAAHKLASNRLVNVEDLTEDELRIIKEYYISLSELSKSERSLQESHSIDEANSRHIYKSNTQKELYQSTPKTKKK